MRLSVLDQSPVIGGHAPSPAVRETIRLAQATEALGYHRYRPSSREPAPSA